MDLRKWIVGWLFLTLVSGGSTSAASETPPLLGEVYQLLRTNLTDVSPAELERAVVEGFVQRLAPRAKLLLNESERGSSTNTIGRVTGIVFDEAFGYLRVSQVSSGLERELTRVYDSIAAGKTIKGLVLDLRFAEGDDYPASVAAASWFIASEQPLLDWGAGTKNSSAREDALKVPVVVLVNKKTSGAAEALAAMLRQTDIGLILGTNTAGTAAIAKEFNLSTGQRLRIYSTPVKLGNGKPLPVSGLKPDIEVEVSEEDELAYLADAYKVIPKPERAGSAAVGASGDTNAPGTNRAPRRRINEAELVRMQREGQMIDAEIPARRPLDPGKPVVLDPALARALDLLKGLSVVQNVRSR